MLGALSLPDVSTAVTEKVSVPTPETKTENRYGDSAVPLVVGMGDGLILVAMSVSVR